jgi:hypothetical protein
MTSGTPSSISQVFVGVAEIVQVHAGLDPSPSEFRVAGQCGQPDAAAEVGAAVQATVGAGEHELGCVATAS